MDFWKCWKRRRKRRRNGHEVPAPYFLTGVRDHPGNKKAPRVRGSVLRNRVSSLLHFYCHRLDAHNPRYNIDEKVEGGIFRFDGVVRCPAGHGF